VLLVRLTQIIEPLYFKVVQGSEHLYVRHGIEILLLLMLWNDRDISLTRHVSNKFHWEPNSISLVTLVSYHHDQPNQFPPTRCFSSAICAKSFLSTSVKLVSKSAMRVVSLQFNPSAILDSQRPGELYTLEHGLSVSFSSFTTTTCCSSFVA
jgi:hypothetical protein